MYINKLYLRAFGKFTYKRLYLGKKFNIIYGENETGKSTIHNFIESILYGFDDNSRGADLYKKYKPWDSDLYRGTITIDEVNGKKYLISRDFLLNTTQVLDKDTEEEKDASIPEEYINCPGEYFFNINKLSYRNTVSIQQLGNKTDKELSAELKNKIVNLSNSRDESISINRILATLNNIKDEAGNEENPKTLLGQYALRLKELEMAKENTVNANRQVMFLAMEKKKLNSKIQEIDMLISGLENELYEYELSIEKDKYLKAVPLKEELEEVNKKLNLYKDEDKEQKFSKDDYIEATQLYSSLIDMKNERLGLINKRTEAEAVLKDLKEDLSNNITDDSIINNINEDFSSYETNKQKINELQAKIAAGKKSIEGFDLNEINKLIESYGESKENKAKIDIIKILLNDNSYEVMKKIAKSQNIKSILLTLLGLMFFSAAALSGYAAYYYAVSEYYYGTAAAVFGIFSLITAVKSKNRASNAIKEIESIECRNADQNKNLEILEERVDELLEAAGCSDMSEFKNLYEVKKNQLNIINEKLKLLEFDNENLDSLIETNDNLSKKLLNSFKIFNMEEITKENAERINEIYNRKDSVKAEIINFSNLIDEINQNLNKMDKEIAFEEKRLNIILTSNNIRTIDDFKNKVERYENYLELKNKKEYCESFLNTMLERMSFEELKQRTEKINSYEVKNIDRREYQLAIFKNNEEKTKLLIGMNNIDKEIDEIEKGVRNLAEIEEEIEFYEDKKALFKEKIQIAEIAAEKIIEISDSIKGDFMPLLRKSISDNFAYVTGGKYKEVNIDEDMNITVVAENNKERNIEIESLSGGTLDQLYLSLRISLSSILSGNQNIPIILDDSFVQYDTNRLKKSIEMLARESERRQIILFTCQEREIEFAKQLNVKFNLIKLQAKE